MRTQALALDPGVLGAGPVCEFQAWRAVRDRGGAAVLPWRASYAEAKSAGVEAVPEARALPDSCLPQCVVHLQKSRAGTWRDLADAWRVLEPGGRLVLSGGNDLGIVSAVKRLARELGQTPRILANRAKGRAVGFEKAAADAGPPMPASSQIEVPVAGGSSDFRIDVAPGVFSAKHLDGGTQELLACLEGLPPPRRLLDAGCGAGTLALAALRRWPHAQALLADGDARAVACASANAESLGVAERSRVLWWNAGEPLPEADFDLVLLNPPFHSGKPVDLSAARAMFAAVAASLSSSGRALVVANRKLPYERNLQALGRVKELRARRGFKVLEVRSAKRG